MDKMARQARREWYKQMFFSLGAIAFLAAVALFFN